MKKLLFLLTMAISVILLCGCQTKTDHTARITQLRTNVLTGENGGYKVSLFFETREQPFIADGKIGENKSVAIVKLKTSTTPSEGVKVVFTIDKEYSSDFSYKSTSNEYVATIELASGSVSNLTVTVVDGENSTNVELYSVLTDKTIFYKDALSVVLAEKTELSKGLEGGELNAELHVRLINVGGRNLWCVGIVTAEKTYAFLIDGKKAKITAEREISNNP